MNITTLHITNTDLELELIDSSELPLEKALDRNPIVHQLQFLPLLYKENGDGLCVTDPPLEGLMCSFFTDKHFPFKRVESWGPSKRVAKWASQHSLSYEMPEWEIVKQVNSKAFSFLHSPRLPGSELLASWKELETWMRKIEGAKVLKTCFGLSGQGHLLLPTSPPKLQSFVEKEFQAQRPLIGEPWVQRQIDFSTQWILGQGTLEKEPTIHYVGSTLLQSDEKGRYSGTQVGDEGKLFGHFCACLEQHKTYAYDILKKMGAMGFFGHVGIDAMIWGESILHPIVEINARKTMGWVALQIAKRLFPKQTIQVSYCAATRSFPLLPSGIITPQGRVKKFHRNLYVDTLA